MSGSQLLLLGGTPQVVSDPNFEYTTLLLPGNGTNGAQNNTFLDSSTNAFSITRNGNTTQGTFSPFSQTGWGNYFDGTGDYLTIADNTALQPGGGAFTYEAWVYPLSYPGAGSFKTLWAQRANSSGYGGPAVVINSSGTLLYYISNAAATNWQISGSSSGFTLPLNQWSHVAIVRSVNTCTIYLNGTAGTSVTLTENVGVSAALSLMAGGADGTQAVDGYMSNFRLVKGTAVYTSNFTPSTTPLTAITNTSLLTCQSNRFIDNSANNFTITRNGDVSVQAFSPFNPTAAWSAATNGGSGYFDGSGDYLNTASNAAFAFGSGSFTIEMWVYSGANGTSTRLGGNGAGGSFTTNRWIIATSTAANPNKFTLAAFNTSPVDLLVSTSTFNNSQWMHVAIARSGNAWAMWVNGAREAYVASNSAALDGGSSEVFNLGRSNLSGDADWAGYVSGFKMVKGTAVYDPASTTITIPTAPPANTTNTSLLLNFTNAGIYDATSKNDLETVGNAQISTTQSKFGGSSMYFDGTGDYLRAPFSAINRINTSGNFTIEFWAYFNSVAADQRLIAWDNNSTNFVAAIYTNTSGNLAYYLSSTGTTWNIAIATSMGSIAINTWYHVALVRNGSVFTPYINGVAGTTTTSSATLFASTLPLVIGATGNGASFFNGYIDDFRITNGVARYTSNFTPPTTAFPLL